MILRIAMHSHYKIAMLLLSFVLFAVKPATAQSTGIEAQEGQSESDPQDSYYSEESFSDPVLAEEVEAAIGELSSPSDGKQISQILFNLGHLNNLQEQARLQRLFDQRMGEIAQSATLVNYHPTSEISQIQSSSLNLASEVMGAELSARIEMLKLGPQATADDLRVRDQIVSLVAQVTDPLAREQLLQQLEAREREENSSTSQPLEQNQRLSE